MQVFTWNDSLAVRLPETLVAEMGLKDGDELAIVESSKQKVVVEKWTGGRGSSRTWSSFAGLPPKDTNSIVTKRTSGDHVRDA